MIRGIAAVTDKLWCSTFRFIPTESAGLLLEKLLLEQTNLHV